jgi:outer membrane receptor protein involved in Fe transport
MRTALRILSALAIALAVQAAWAGNTGKISGKVTDAKTREPLVGVNVLIAGTKQGAATDARGEFFIANVPAGTYALRMTQVGYKIVQMNEVQVRADATTEVKLALEETVLELGQEVVVTAERPLVQKDNTATRVYVESAEIRNLPASNVADVLQTIPSVNNDNGVMSVRGGGLNEVSFLIDGARARNPNDQTPYTSINLSSIQEMEVITGSYSAEYGEARSGVFNVITKEGSQQFHAFADARYTPPGVKHWGPSLYDPTSTLYWENTHARHLQWWIDYPDQWVDQTGRYGNDPRCAWSPQQAYQNYLATHKPLTNYDKQAGYSGEISIGGPVPLAGMTTFFLSGKYRVEPPIMGNSYLDKGQFFDGTAKLTHQIDPATKLTFSGFVGIEKSSWGIEGGPDYFWASNYGIDSRYAYYDWAGYPTNETNGQTIKLTHVADAREMYEVKASRVYARRKIEPFPNDPVGWDATTWTTDLLRAGVRGGDANRIGFNTTGYYYRYDDRNTDWTLTGFYSNQLTNNFQLRAGGEFTYYNLNHFNQAKSPDRHDSRTYNPYQGAGYVQTKLEFSGFIMNAGLRFDLYNSNDVNYLDLFDPLVGPASKTKTFTQFSPRLGISHPIDEYTVLHFSYGHFFQRTPFFDNGESGHDYDTRGSLTTFVIDGTTVPFVLGNRDVKPEKTIAFELGIERNFFEDFVLGATAYYKDVRNTLRFVTIQGPLLHYATIGNGNYADVRGIELSLRKRASTAAWGTTWGYVNFTTQIAIYGASGDPISVTPDGSIPNSSAGDILYHQDPRLKAGLFYETPANWDLLGGALERLSVSLDYQAVFANDMRQGDYFPFGGQKYLRPANQNTNLRVKKDFALMQEHFRFGVYVEVRNLFNNQWLNLDSSGPFYSATTEDQQRFAASNLTVLPAQDANGTPILPLSMYQNLPRMFIFGITLEL